jgi:hypothetical protein
VEEILDKPRQGWDDNIKIHLRKIGYEDVNLIELVHNRVQ